MKGRSIEILEEGMCQQFFPHRPRSFEVPVENSGLLEVWQNLLSE